MWYGNRRVLDISSGFMICTDQIPIVISLPLADLPGSFFGVCGVVLTQCSSWKLNSTNSGSRSQSSSMERPAPQLDEWSRSQRRCHKGMFLSFAMLLVLAKYFTVLFLEKMDKSASWSRHLTYFSPQKIDKSGSRCRNRLYFRRQGESRGLTSRKQAEM
jgi:hypothetical protein